MRVILAPEDKICLTYHNVDDKDVVVVWVDQGDEYAVLWQWPYRYEGTYGKEGAEKPIQNGYELLWKGTWESCIRWFTSFIGDLEAERAPQGVEAVTSPGAENTPECT